jgi:hypothetical protein
MKKLIVLLVVLLLSCTAVFAAGNGNSGTSGKAIYGESETAETSGTNGNGAVLQEHKSEVTGLENAMLRVRNEERQRLGGRT